MTVSPFLIKDVERLKKAYRGFFCVSENVKV